MPFIDRSDDYVLAEAVYEHAYQAVLRLDGDFRLISRVHPEQRIGIVRDVEPAERIMPLAFFIEYPDLRHLVDTVVDDSLMLGVVGNKVVLLIIPHESPRTQLIPPAAVTRFHLFFQIPVKISETDLAVGTYGRVYLVYVIVDALVHGLHAAGDNDLSVKLRALIFADK